MKGYFRRVDDCCIHFLTSRVDGFHWKLNETLPETCCKYSEMKFFIACKMLLQCHGVDNDKFSFPYFHTLHVEYGWNKINQGISDQVTDQFYPAYSSPFRKRSTY